jgi:hypothetical protein
MTVMTCAPRTRTWVWMTLTEMGIAAHDVEEAARLANAFRDDVLDR